ncbi:Sphingolipid C4-hydroxylase sur2 [Lecanora helva]
MGVLDSGINLSLPPFAALTDPVIATIAPPLVFWATSLTFHAFDEFKLFQKYKLIPEDEASKRNIAKKSEVVKSVLTQHAIQTSLGILALQWEDEAPPLDDPLGLTGWLMRRLIDDNPAAQQSRILSFLFYFAILLARQVTAFVIYDTWQYWVHWFGHVNTWAYRNVHSRHHRLYVPYAFGALYSHPLEGFFLDTLGGWVSYQMLGLTHRERAVFFTVSTVKTVDDHCGYEFPWDPIIWLGHITGSEMVYHTIHHQPWGIKTNYGLFFTFWDDIMNTRYRGTRNVGEVKRKVEREAPPPPPEKLDEALEATAVATGVQIRS